MFDNESGHPEELLPYNRVSSGRLNLFVFG